MATFYIDPVGGNDANDGLSFANRWKTLTSGATTARTAPGDVIRVIASPDPVSLGNVQWTDGSVTLTPATSRNKVVPGFTSAWTAAANIVASQGSTSSVQKTSTTYLNLAPAAGFTTGKAAYVTLGATLDLSAYQQISFWGQWTGSGRTFTINLCSDTTGDVPIVSLTVPEALGWTTLYWRSVVIDNGAPLPSGINSISISIGPTDPGTANLRITNVVACKAPGNDEITHNTLIGKNTAGEPWWYTINEITDTELRIGGSMIQLNSNDPARPYKGTTESVTTYKRDCLPAWASSERTLAEGGTSGNPITISGGWDRTDMSTQTGETWLTGSYYNGYLFTAAASTDYIKVEKIGIAHYYYGIGECNHGWDIDLVGALGCGGPVISGDSPSAGTPTMGKIRIKQVWGVGGGNLSDSSSPFTLDIDLIHGSTETAVGNCIIPYVTTRVLYDGQPPMWKIKEISNNASCAVELSVGGIRLHGCLMKDNQADLAVVSLSVNRLASLFDCTLQSATKIYYGASYFPFRLEETRIGGNPLLNKTTIRSGSWESQQAVVYAAGGTAWALSPTSTRHDFACPLVMPLGKVAVKANKLVTVKYQMRRTNTALTCGLSIDGSVPGTTETRVPMTAAADTWEEVTLTFTPTVAAVVELFGYAYGGTTHTAYFDSPTITQAD